MTSAPGSDSTRESTGSFKAWEILPALVLVTGAIVQVVWMDPRHWDLALAYRGGLEAWSSGHPEWIRSWMSTPLLALVMALVAHGVSEDQATLGIVVLSLATIGIALWAVWKPLRMSLPVPLWWTTLALAGFFAPTLSCLFYKQINIFVFGVVLGGFAAVRARRAGLGGSLIGFAVAL